MDYLEWQSDLTLKQVFEGGTSFSYPCILNDQETLYLSKNRNDNRSVLKLLGNEATRCLTPAPYSLQTRVNEYGGKSYWVSGSSFVFANQADQCLYRQDILPSGVSEPIRVSPKPNNTKRYMYTDVHKLSTSNYLAIIELERSDICHANNGMFIGAIGHPDTDPVSLIQGADFYSNLVLNKAQNKAAWVQWNHPNMPWDDTQLWVADVINDAGNLRLQNQVHIDLSVGKNAGSSVCQLLFSNNDRLFFSADYRADVGAERSLEHAPSLNTDDYWNVHVYDFLRQEVVKVTKDKLEHGYPHWVYGDHRIVQFDDTQLLVVASDPAGDRLVLIDQHSLEYRHVSITKSCCSVQHLQSDGLGNCVFELLPFDHNPSLVKLSYPENDEITVLLEPAELESEVSAATPICFNTRDEAQAYGFYYAPLNRSQQELTSSDTLPPLLVMVHGGPTARAYGHFDLQKQFWTSRGFAILDVNHRGSSGYGRRFRDSLYGHWGERDTSDIVDGINYLIERGKVDANRICIRGKSAGGYAVLRALTEYPELFKVGACYYGIGNLVTLAETTHKFEKHYTDRLIDEVFDVDIASTTSSKFYQRSPINKMSQLNSAMIVFQGALDRVVPPSVANEIISVLINAKIDHEYVEYSNEGHGFKLPENNIDAWARELDFYRRVLSK